MELTPEAQAMCPTLPAALVQFVDAGMAGVDASHSLDAHLIPVYEMAFDIFFALPSTVALPPGIDHSAVLMYASLLHDYLDHKYFSTATDGEERRVRLPRFLYEQLPDLTHVQLVLDIIDNVSFSKQRRGECADLGAHQILLDIVRDADRLDALGHKGIERCRHFSRAQNPSASDAEVEREVVQHARDKLLVLRDYIVTAPGRQRADELHRVIESFVQEGGS